MPDPAAPGATAPYDALLLVSFGGPEKPADVLPFLENVTRGRGIPRERLADVAHHYDGFGGRSPINDQCRELLAALRAELDSRATSTCRSTGATATGTRSSAPRSSGWPPTGTAAWSRC